MKKRKGYERTIEKKEKEGEKERKKRKIEGKREKDNAECVSYVTLRFTDQRKEDGI